MPEFLLVDRPPGQLRVTINRATKRNPLSRAVLAELDAVFNAHRDDDSLVVATITGAGDKAFAAGGDLKEFDALRSAEDAAQLFANAARALDAIRGFPVPVVAVLNGTALGGGAELALACDYRVAAAHAHIGFVQNRLAITTGFGGGCDLFRLLGPHRAMDVLLRAKVFSADEAQKLGLIDVVATPDAGLDATLPAFLAPLLRARPQVVRAVKRQALAELREATFAERRATEQTNFIETWIHPDHWTAAAQLLADLAPRTRVR